MGTWLMQQWRLASPAPAGRPAASGQGSQEEPKFQLKSKGHLLAASAPPLLRGSQSSVPLSPPTDWVRPTTPTGGSPLHSEPTASALVSATSFRARSRLHVPASGLSLLLLKCCCQSGCHPVNADLPRFLADLKVFHLFFIF